MHFSTAISSRFTHKLRFNTLPPPDGSCSAAIELLIIHLPSPRANKARRGTTRSTLLNASHFTIRKRPVTSFGGATVGRAVMSRACVSRVSYRCRALGSISQCWLRCAVLASRLLSTILCTNTVRTTRAKRIQAATHMLRRTIIIANSSEVSASSIELAQSQCLTASHRIIDQVTQLTASSACARSLLSTPVRCIALAVSVGVER